MKAKLEEAIAASERAIDAMHHADVVARCAVSTSVSARRKIEITEAAFVALLSTALDAAPLCPLLIADLRPMIANEQGARATAWLLRVALRTRLDLEEARTALDQLQALERLRQKIEWQTL